ncbi:MAG: hypothetical protein P9M13_09805 [Candidatus Ancaeobacter aquaticus]|nr:hypothetical protein [Candidatus Ancaeobacter aquaticus]
MANEAEILSCTPLYKIIPYRVLKWTVVVTGTYIYFTCFSWNPLFALIMIPMFAYLFFNVVGLVIHFFIYLFSSPFILTEDFGYIEEGIPSDCKVVFFRPIFASNAGEMDTVLASMEQDIVNSQEPHKNLKFIVIDNTRNEDVKQYTRVCIKELQDKHGEDVVFYFHRNVKCDFFKKVGIYMDAIMFLHQGVTRPYNYIDPEWNEVTKGTRDKSFPLWDEILGDIKALGIDAPIEDVLAGKHVTVNENERIKVSIVCDADNVWPQGQVRKIVAKIMHPSNSHLTIFQPAIELSNSDENIFIKCTSWARQMYGFDLVAKWRLYHFSPFFGKGAMNVENYVNEIIKSQWLNPGKAASHDFQEALKAWSVYVEDVYIMEKTFSNKLAELTRGALWQRGDLETVENYITKKFEAGRKNHLYVLLGNLINNPIYSLWVTGTCLAWMIPALATTIFPQRLFFLFAGILVAWVAVPMIAVPVISKYKEKTYDPPCDLIYQKNFLKILSIAGIELVITVCVNMLDLVYKTQAIIQNIRKQVSGKAYVWKTGAMSELETANASLLQMYKNLYLSTIIGVGLVLGTFFGVFPWIVSIFIFPYTASFLLGPFVIWYTAKSIKIDI